MSKLGKYIELSELKNVDQNYSKPSVVGISTKKGFIETKGDLSDVDIKTYRIVKPRYFAYVEDTSRRGDKISLAFNFTKETLLVSTISKIFYVKDENELLPEYLFMYFNRSEFDRYSRFNSWGSARETFSYEDLCDIDIKIPPIEEQRKFVAVYLALLENQKKYEQGLDDLKLVCDSTIENLRKKHQLVKVGEYIEEIKEINTELSIVYERGLNKEFGFVEPGSMSDNVDLSKRKIIRFDTFVYPSPHFGEQGTIGLNKGQDCIMSQMYTNFKIIKSDLLPDYLFLWLKRDEFMRYGFFAACDSVRDTFDIGKLGEYKIPIPDMRVQKSIADIYDVLKRRKMINEVLKTQLFEICAILVKGSLIN